MRYHISVKFLAIALAALSLFAAVGSAVGVIALATMDLYETSVDELYEEEMASVRRSFAVNLAHRYASLELGHIPEEYLSEYRPSQWLYTTYSLGQYFYVIRDENGIVVESTLDSLPTDAKKYEITVTEIRYRRLLRDQSATPEEPDAPASGATGPQESLPSENATEPEPSTQPLPDGTEAGQTEDAGTAVASSTDEIPEIHQGSYYDSQQQTYVELCYQYASLPPYTVELYLLPNAVKDDPLWDVIKTLWVYRMELFYVLGFGLLVFAVCAVYLCCAAGRHPKRREVRPGGLNCIPLDFYAGAVGLGLFVAISLIVLGFAVLADRSPKLLLPFLFFSGFGVCLVAVGFLFACAAQFKTPGYYWWHHSVIGFICTRIWRLARRIVRFGHELLRMLPIIWQWLLTAFIMVMAVVISFLLAAFSHYLLQPFFSIVFIFSILGCIGVVCYGGYCFGVLFRGARYMSQGNLYHQIPTRYLFGAFRDFALRLNSLAGAAQIAAERQLRSERMKTELITNVSHDIKTPLTSIINYVDLMKKPHSEEEDRQYLEVLDRQSQRLKKLIDDLMDMSKASTGNMSVEISRMDAAETINQVLGEFSDKLDRVDLTPVFHSPEEPVYMLADGKLVWRVMSNLLGNAVKYAMPHTRLYVDLAAIDGRVIISMKNISREELNVRADELLERFVRGDLSRNTEGSGLGLNIAQSLMELQKGQLQLLVDGDLFKVTLIFPGA